MQGSPVVRTLPYNVFLLGCALLLGACGGERLSPEPEPDVGAQAASPPALARGEQQGPRSEREGAHGELEEARAARTVAMPGEPGRLTVRASSGLRRRLSSITYVVENATGEVVAGGADDAGEHGSRERELQLALPPGEGFHLKLTAAAVGADSSTCEAEAGPFAIEPGADASLQLFVWRCDGAPGAEGPEPECYWLADWIGVQRTRARADDLIAVTVAGRDSTGEPAAVSWSTGSPSLGSFTSDTGADTSFRCGAERGVVELTAALRAGACHKRLSARVTCE